jgi:DNA invertase Pin-like site-specific DNA recombinase
MCLSYGTIYFTNKGVDILKIGYARVSTGLQNLDLQEDSLKSEGCQKIFTDKISGSKSKRPGLENAIDFAREGDTIVVWRLDRLGRNMQDLITIVNQLNDRGISFYSIQENITMDKSSSTGQLMFHLFAAFAEFERNLILERSQAGREAARARGRVGGRPEKLTKQDLELLKALVDNETPIKTVADQWNVSRTTIYRYLNKMEADNNDRKEQSTN